MSVAVKIIATVAICIIAVAVMMIDHEKDNRRFFGTRMPTFALPLRAVINERRRFRSHGKLGLLLLLTGGLVFLWLLIPTT